MPSDPAAAAEYRTPQAARLALARRRAAAEALSDDLARRRELRRLDAIDRFVDLWAATEPPVRLED